MGYQKVFNKPYEEGYKNLPDKSTPVTAEILNMQDDTFESVEDYLENLTDGMPTDSFIELLQEYVPQVNPATTGDEPILTGLSVGEEVYRIPSSSTAEETSYIANDIIDKGNVQGAIDLLVGIDRDANHIYAISVDNTTSTFHVVCKQMGIDDTYPWSNNHQYETFKTFAYGGNPICQVTAECKVNGIVRQKGYEPINATLRNPIEITHEVDQPQPIVAFREQVETTHTTAERTIEDASGGNIVALALVGATTQGANPSPSNPQPINGFDGRMGTSGKNLLDTSKFINLNNDLRELRITLKPNTAYTFSTSQPKNMDNGANVFFANINENYSTTSNGVWNDKSITRTSDANGEFKIAYRDTRIPNEKSFWDFYYQLEEGTVATEYVPYKNPSTIHTFQLYSIGNVKDELRVFADGSGEYVKKFGSVTFDGSESGWSMDSDGIWVGTKGNSFYKTISEKAFQDKDVVCDRYISKKRNYSQLWTDNCVCIAGAGTIIEFLRTEFNNIDDWKEFLRNNPTQVIFPLYTPTTTKLTPSEVSEILKLKTYATKTYVDAENVEFNLEYFADSEIGKSLADVNSKVETKADKSVFESYIADFISIANRTYKGKDLTVAFADEIKNFSDEWAWIKDRKTRGDFSGINVCDYIPVTFSNGYVINMQIMGMNTYKGYADQEVGNHIDFIGEKLWQDLHVMNKVNFNNGNANSPNPFLASDLNYWLNSKSGNVPNSTSDASVTVAVDYTNSGVLHFMPDKVKNQIIPKRVLLPGRYTAGSVLTNDNSYAWYSTDKLWILSEVEVYGATCWGNNGFGAGGFVHYPYFANNMNRLKKRCSTNDRSNWWLLLANSGDSTSFASVSGSGNANLNLATATHIPSPICFRI